MGAVGKIPSLTNLTCFGKDEVVWVKTCSRMTSKSDDSNVKPKEVKVVTLHQQSKQTIVTI